MNRNKNPRMVYKRFSVHSPLVETATKNNLITGISCLVTCHTNYVLMQLWQISNLLSQTVNVTFQISNLCPISAIGNHRMFTSSLAAGFHCTLFS